MQVLDISFFTGDAEIDFVTRKSYTYKNNLDFSNKLTAANNLTQLTQANGNPTLPPNECAAGVASLEK